MAAEVDTYFHVAECLNECSMGGAGAEFDGREKHERILVHIFRRRNVARVGEEEELEHWRLDFRYVCYGITLLEPN